MRDVSIISLVLANLAPLFGVLFWDWNPASIIVTYWMENVVIGFYNVLKMIKAAQPTPSDAPPIIINMPWWKGPRHTRTKSAFIWSFIAFYGIFTAVHGAVVFTIFKPITFYFAGTAIAVCSLFISHGISYARNFIGKREYQKITPDSLIFQPFKRVFFMQAAVLAGGFAAQTFGATIFALAVLVFLKIFVDLLTHRYLHSLVAKLPSQMPESLENFIKSRLRGRSHFGPLRRSASEASDAKARVNLEKISPEESKRIHELLIKLMTTIMNNAFRIIVKKIKEKYGRQ